MANVYENVTGWLSLVESLPAQECVQAANVSTDRKRRGVIETWRLFLDNYLISWI